MSDESNADRRRTLRLELAYDGTDFAGWQFQPGLRTVQGTLEAAIRPILDDERVAVVGAGRTDSGAHAVAQVAHVVTASTIRAAALGSGLNSALPRDLRVRRVEDAPVGFHARFSATGKEYRYQFWHGSPVPPFLRNYCLGVHNRLDVAAMSGAAALFEGTLDLSSFRAAACSAKSPQRTIEQSRIAEHGPLVVYAIHSKGFLQHMVRIIAGTLLAVGRGRIDLDQVRRIIAARDRTAAPATVSASGLFLVRVEYGTALEARAMPVLTFDESMT